MTVGKENSSCGKSINLRRLNIWVSAQNSNPIVQIVDSNEQHTGRCSVLRGDVVRADDQLAESDRYYQVDGESEYSNDDARVHGETRYSWVNVFDFVTDTQNRTWDRDVDYDSFHPCETQLIGE